MFPECEDVSDSDRKLSTGLFRNFHAQENSLDLLLSAVLVANLRVGGVVVYFVRSRAVSSG
jgi:hypothetical protein